jgi:hypothetical protein
MTRPRDDDDETLARAQRQAEDAPAHPRELGLWLAAEDSTETEDDRI